MDSACPLCPDLRPLTEARYSVFVILFVVMFKMSLRSTTLPKPRILFLCRVLLSIFTLNFCISWWALLQPSLEPVPEIHNTLFQTFFYVTAMLVVGLLAIIAQ